MMMAFIAVLLAVPTQLAADSLTTTRVIRPDTILELQDITVLAKDFPGAVTPDESIIGLEARNTLYPGRPIRSIDVGPVALVKRNQHVKLVFRQGTLTIATEARALERGTVGDFVRVMNLASRSTVFGQVALDGSVIVAGAGR